MIFPFVQVCLSLLQMFPLISRLWLFYFSQNVWTFLLSLFMQYKCPFFRKYLYLAFPSMCCLFFHRFDLSFQPFTTFSSTFSTFSFLLGLAYWAFDNRLLTPQVVCNSALCKPISKFSFLLLPIFCITFAFTQLRSDFDQLVKVFFQPWQKSK